MGRLESPICFFLNGISFIAVIAGSYDDETSAADAARSLTLLRWNTPGVGSFIPFKHPRVRTIFMLFFAVGVFGWSYTVLMPAFARDVLGRGANGYGLLISASGAGALIGALLVAAYGHLVTPRKLAFGGVYLFSAAVIILAFTTQFLLLVRPACSLSGFGMLLFFATSNTTLQTIVPDEMRGRVMGIWSLVFGMMIPVGSHRSRSSRKFVWNTLCAGVWRHHLPGSGHHYANCDCAARSGSGNLGKLQPQLLALVKRLFPNDATL